MANIAKFFGIERHDREEYITSPKNKPKGIVNDSEIENRVESLETVVSKMSNDFNRIFSGVMEKEPEQKKAEEIIEDSIEFLDESMFPDEDLEVVVVEEVKDIPLPTEDTEAYWFETSDKILGSNKEDSVFDTPEALEKNVDQSIMCLIYTLRDAVGVRDMETIRIISKELIAKTEDFFAYYNSANNERLKRKEIELETKDGLDQIIKDMKGELNEKDEKIGRLERKTTPIETPKVMVNRVQTDLSSKTMSSIEQYIKEAEIDGMTKEDLIIQVTSIIQKILGRINSLKKEQPLKKNIIHGITTMYFRNIGINDNDFIQNVKTTIIYRIFTDELIEHFNKTRELLC